MSRLRRRGDSRPPALESGSRSSHGWGANRKPDQLVGLSWLTVLVSTFKHRILHSFTASALSGSLGIESVPVAHLRVWMTGFCSLGARVWGEREPV